MKTPDFKILLLALVLLCSALSAASTPASDEMPTVKKERNHIRSGNKLYKAKRYAEAEVEYRKALQEAPTSAIAQFNLATALMRQGSATAKQQGKDDPMSEAQALLDNLVQHCPNRDLRGKAAYDLGNIAYAQQNWAQAIEHYKEALRCNPDDNHARDNLRLAQLKKQQQDKQDKNKNQNKDQNQDKDKQDKDKQNQDKQNQDKQNQDKQDQDKQNQDKQNQDKQDQDKQNQDKNQQNGQQPNQRGMSQQNAEQVLKAMQDQERNTQQRVKARQAQQRRGERARTNHKW